MAAGLDSNHRPTVKGLTRNPRCWLVTRLQPPPYISFLRLSEIDVNKIRVKICKVSLTSKIFIELECIIGYAEKDRVQRVDERHAGAEAAPRPERGAGVGSVPGGHS